jgi:hypothetical protein
MLLVLKPELIDFGLDLVVLQHLLILLLGLLKLLLDGTIEMLTLSLGRRLQGERLSLGHRGGAPQGGSEKRGNDKSFHRGLHVIGFECPGRLSSDSGALTLWSCPWNPLQ